MFRSDAHHAEARRCRRLAATITDGEARTFLTHMTQLYDTMAAVTIKQEVSPRPRLKI